MAVFALKFHFPRRQVVHGWEFCYNISWQQYVLLSTAVIFTSSALCLYCLKAYGCNNVHKHVKKAKEGKGLKLSGISSNMILGDASDRIGRIATKKLVGPCCHLKISV